MIFRVAFIAPLVLAILTSPAQAADPAQPLPPSRLPTAAWAAAKMVVSPVVPAPVVRVVDGDTRAALSREFCRRIGWLKPDGGLKDMMARVTMLAMHRDGVIALPPPRGRRHQPRPIVFGPDTEPPLFPAPTTLDEVRPVDLRPVVRETREGKLWNEFVARYHYLGYKTLVGAQMRYAVHDRNGWPLAMLGFSTAAWKLAPRDNFIGWTPLLREKNLPLAVDNPSPRHQLLAIAPSPV